MSELVRVGMELDPSGLVRGVNVGTQSLSQLQAATEATNAVVASLSQQLAAGLAPALAQAGGAEVAFTNANLELAAAQDAALVSAATLAQAEARLAAVLGTGTPAFSAYRAATAAVAVAQQEATATAAALAAAERGVAVILAAETEAAAAAAAATQALAASQTEAAVTAKAATGGFSAMAGGALAAVAALAVLAKALSGVVSAAAEAEETEERLGAVLKATGFAAGFSKEELIDYANQLQASFLTTDEAAKESIAILATFRRVQGDTFKQGIEIAHDMATVMGTDVKQAIVQVGKALNDPILGVGALRRVGVQLTTQQEAQVRAMVKVNDIAGAQKIVLAELKGEFGGAAAASNRGLTGAIKNARVAYEDFLESLGRNPKVNLAVESFFTGLSAIFKNLTGKGPLEEAKADLDEVQGKLKRIADAQKLAVSEGRPLVDLSRITRDLKLQEGILQSRVNFIEGQRSAAAALADSNAEAAEAAAKAADEETRKAEAGEAAAKAAADNRQAIEEQIDALEQELEAFGKTEAEIAVLAAARRGATKEQQDQIRALANAIAAKEKAEEAATKGEEAAADARERLNEATRETIKQVKDRIQSAKDEALAFVAGVDAQQAAHQATLDVIASRDKDVETQVAALKALLAINDALAVHKLRLDGVDETTIALFIDRQKLANQMEIETLLAEDAAGKAEVWAEAWTQAVRNIQGELAGLIEDTLQGVGSIDEFARNVIRTIQRMLAEIAAAKAIESLGGSLFGGVSAVAAASGGGGGGGVGGLGGSDAVFTGFAHNGGVVGSPTTGRVLDPAVFRGALRMHDGGVAGLAPDEVPTILQKGEIVLPKGGGPREARSDLSLRQDVNFNIAALDSRSVETMLRQQKGTILSLVLDGVKDSTQFRNQLFTR